MFVQLSLVSFNSSGVKCMNNLLHLLQGLSPPLPMRVGLICTTVCLSACLQQALEEYRSTGWGMILELIAIPESESNITGERTSRSSFILLIWRHCVRLRGIRQPNWDRSLAQWPKSKFDLTLYTSVSIYSVHWLHLKSENYFQLDQGVNQDLKSGGLF